MKMERFFLWCAGSDQEVLRHCTRSEKIKHIGFGSLVIIPAILAFISMSFALSTIAILQDLLWLQIMGGLIWAAIIFSFDRFIVSTHRKRKHHKAELHNPAFYLRLSFAFILGIIISHPLVMMYFNGSIEDQLIENERQYKIQLAESFDQQLAVQRSQIAFWDSLVIDKEASRNQQALMVSQEIDGAVMNNQKLQLTTGLRGKGPAAEEKIKHLHQLQSDLDDLKTEAKRKQTALLKDIEDIKAQKSLALLQYKPSKDYLKRELALQQLKEEYPLVALTQWFLIALFVLVDILPFIFKTFAPYGMYDKILSDDYESLKDLDTTKRKAYNQHIYNKLSEIS